MIIPINHSHTCLHRSTILFSLDARTKKIHHITHPHDGRTLAGPGPAAQDAQGLQAAQEGGEPKPEQQPPPSWEGLGQEPARQWEPLEHGRKRQMVPPQLPQPPRPPQPLPLPRGL